MTPCFWYWKRSRRFLLSLSGIKSRLSEIILEARQKITPPIQNNKLKWFRRAWSFIIIACNRTGNEYNKFEVASSNRTLYQALVAVSSPGKINNIRSVRVKANALLSTTVDTVQYCCIALARQILLFLVQKTSKALHLSQGFGTNRSVPHYSQYKPCARIQQ